MELEKGKYINLSDKEYHELEQISSHGLMKVLRSPAHYMFSKMHKTEPSKAMIMGTIMHDIFSAVITGNKSKTIQDIMNTFCVADKRTKEGKLLAETKTVVNQEDHSNILGMSEMLINNSSVLELVSGIEYSEHAAIVSLESIGYNIEARFKPDAIHTQCIIEYKTTDDASLNEFMKTSCNYMYDLQAAFYMMCDEIVTGRERACHLYIVQESKAPYEIAIYESSTEYLQDGMSLALKAINIYADAVAKNEFSGYGLAPKLLNNPSWAKSRHA